MLQKLIEDRIYFTNKVLDWESTIIESSQSLLSEKYMKKEYIESMITNIKEFGPYIIIADGVAMPHSRPEDGALKTGMSFMKIENGVLFPETEIPVTIFFTLVATDNESHIEAIMELADLLGDETKLEKLLSVTNKEELLQIIK